MKHKRCALILTLCVTFGLSLAVLHAADLHEVDVLTNVRVPMRDGVELSANVFLPKAEGRFPAILMRTPYGKGDAKMSDGVFYAQHGYVFVSQDCRGRGQSAGQWEPFLNEARDSIDTHRWVLAQPWCNGKLGTTGGSYVGFTQWAPAPEAGDYLKAMAPVVPLVDPYGDVAYFGGAFNLALLMGWGSMVSYAPGEPVTIGGWKPEDWLKAYKALPLCEWDKVIGKRVEYLRQWVAHPEFDSYWQARTTISEAREIAAPVFAVGGWYDIFAKSTLEHVNTVRRTAKSAAARAHAHVLMGPWTHGISWNGKVGQLDFGRQSVIDLRGLQLQWFDHWLKDADNGVDDWPAFRIFVMGENTWRDEEAWPLERTRYVPYYFRAMTSAKGANGGGQLDTEKPGDEPADTFVYDPHDPVPTLGGCNLMGCPAGPYDQAAAQSRNDVLIFTSRKLQEPLEVTGPVKVVLYAATSAQDTDWTAKLIDVHPDGRAYNLCDGIIRARYREKGTAPSLIEPGKCYSYEIDLWVTSNVFPKDHNIRVEISSSNFPRFDRNPNSGLPFGTDTKLYKATQTVYHDAQRPSHILLPVIP
jgi:putative CocE/NonD family hydrolase